MANLSITFNELFARSNADPALYSRPANDSGESSTRLDDALKNMGLLAGGDHARITPVGNGSTSEICRVVLGWGTLCVKRALPKLKSESDVALPIERSRFEAEWLRLVRAIVGEAVPEVLGQWHGLFAMEYLEPERHRNWATLLKTGDINPSTAAETARMLGRIHAATANNFAVAQRFSTDRIFHATRIKPLLLATAQAQPAVATRLRQLATNTERTRLALVHGDFSPGNLLIGPKAPVLLDAECAWYGDPAFDLALFLSHLLVDCVLQPQWREDYLTCYSAFCASYAQRVTWEMPEQTDERAALLLPALALSHVCGRTPAVGPDREGERNRIAHLAQGLVQDPLVRLAAVREAWRRGMGAA